MNHTLMECAQSLEDFLIDLSARSKAEGEKFERWQLRNRIHREIDETPDYSGATPGDR